MAVKLNRKATLIELKPEYFNVAVQNLRRAESDVSSKMLFSFEADKPKYDPEALTDWDGKFLNYDSLPRNP